MNTPRIVRFVVLPLLHFVLVFGQPNEEPRLEVASIALNPSPGREGRISCDGSRFQAINMPLSAVLLWAYSIPRLQLSGVPNWAERESYTIQAAASRTIGEADCRLMVQRLLEDRFQLVLQRAEQDRAAYNLLISAKGAKFLTKPSETQTAMVNGYPLGGPEGITMQRLADFLSLIPFVARPVVDRTGLTGSYRLTLDFARTPDENASDIFAAVQEQLGLKLESINTPVPMFIVQAMDRPTAN